MSKAPKWLIQNYVLAYIFLCVFVCVCSCVCICFPMPQKSGMLYNLLSSLNTISSQETGIFMLPFSELHCIHCMAVFLYSTVWLWHKIFNPLMKDIELFATILNILELCSETPAISGSPRCCILFGDAVRRTFVVYKLASNGTFSSESYMSVTFLISTIIIIHMEDLQTLQWSFFFPVMYFKGNSHESAYKYSKIYIQIFGKKTFSQNLEKH